MVVNGKISLSLLIEGILFLYPEESELPLVLLDRGIQIDSNVMDLIHYFRIKTELCDLVQVCTQASFSAFNEMPEC